MSTENNNSKIQQDQECSLGNLFPMYYLFLQVYLTYTQSFKDSSQAGNPELCLANVNIALILTTAQTIYGELNTAFTKFESIE